MGRDPYLAYIHYVLRCFNPRARMGRDVEMRFTDIPSWFQSTRPHGARLVVASGSITYLDVSIHAPAWGATKELLFLLMMSLFQSTRPHGARR